MITKRKDKEYLKWWREKCKRIADTTAINPYESDEDQSARISKAKKDYAYFVQYYLPHFATSGTPKFHIKAAKKVKKNKRYKGWFKWGRGLAKSVVSDVSIPLWLWINGDINFFVLVGQNETKAKILLDDIRAEFESNRRLINDFGLQHQSGQWETGFFKTKNGFIGKALGMGQDPRGLRVGSQRPDFIVCDDWETELITNNPKRQTRYAKWLLRSLVPSMDSGNRRVILANNHFTPRMIFSVVLEMMPKWDVIKVNAFEPTTYKPTWKEKYNSEHYRYIVEEEIGTLAANAEYNNDPHVEGSIFKEEYFQWKKLPHLNHMDAIVGHWDIAYAGTSTSDYNAVRVWGAKERNYFLIDCFVKQSKIKPAVLWIAQYQKSLPKSVYVLWRFEAQFWNDEIERIIEEVEEEQNIVLNLVKVDTPTGKKELRIIQRLHPLYQNGRVYHNKKLKGHNDTQQGIAQTKGIEPGYSTKDDAPDADEQAIKYLMKFGGSKNKKPYRVVNRESRKY